MNETKYRVGPKHYNQCTEDSIAKALATVEGFLVDAEVGEVVEITVIKMSDAEYEKLSEYTGP